MGTLIILLNFAVEILHSRRELHNIFKILKEKQNLTTKNIVPDKTLLCKRRTKDILDKQKKKENLSYNKCKRKFLYKTNSSQVWLLIPVTLVLIEAEMEEFLKATDFRQPLAT